MNTLTERVINKFGELFGTNPALIVRSPGRVNIIGEHLDYNDGFVLPAAINKYVCITISSNEDSNCKIVAKDLNEIFEFDLNETLVPNSEMWINYILGVLHQFKEKNLLLKGFIFLVLIMPFLYKDIKINQIL